MGNRTSQLINLINHSTYSIIDSLHLLIAKETIMPPLSLLIKPASGTCNLRCTYCFYHNISQTRKVENYGFMSTETLEKVVQRAFEIAEGQCIFAFQGGEPTLVKLPFYEKLIELVDYYNKNHIKVNYALQTNGYKLNEEWADFFSKHRFLVGLSIDGTIHTHNAYRKDAFGQNTFKEIMNTAHLLKKKKVEFNILTVVNNKTSRSIQKIYAFFKKYDYRYLQYIPCLDPIDEPSGQRDYSLTPEIYGKFLCELFDLWYADLMHGRSVSIRTFDNYISILQGFEPESCDMKGICSVQQVIEADGSVYPCDFYVLDQYKLGNIYDLSFKDLHYTKVGQQFIKESLPKKTQCQTCEYAFLCRGGCKRHREMSGDKDFLNNYFCESNKKFFSYAKDRLIQISRMYR